MSRKVLYRPVVGQLVIIRPSYGSVALYASQQLQYDDMLRGGCAVATKIAMMSEGEIGCIIQVECPRNTFTSIRLLINGNLAWVAAAYVIGVNDSLQQDDSSQEDV